MREFMRLHFALLLLFLLGGCIDEEFANAYVRADGRLYFADTRVAAVWLGDDCSTPANSLGFHGGFFALTPSGTQEHQTTWTPDAEGKILMHPETTPEWIGMPSADLTSIVAVYITLDKGDCLQGAPSQGPVGFLRWCYFNGDCPEITFAFPEPFFGLVPVTASLRAFEEQAVAP